MFNCVAPYRHRWFSRHPYSWLALLLCVSLLFNSAFAAEVPAHPLTVTLSGSGNANANDPYSYYVKMLRLALEKTRVTDGDFAIDFHDHGGGIERDRAMLMAGTGIDVMWASVTADRAEKLRVIDVDLLKGLNNYRAVLIHHSKKSHFDKVETLAELKKFKTGTGPYWTDGVIMKDNGFTLVYGSNYSGLFKMLSLNRFDFFSRGLHEIHSDLLAFGDLGLVRAPRVMLKYDVPVHYCFFVNKDNKKLADRIERGLMLAQADGSFDKLFLSMASFKQGHAILNNPPPHIFVIHNKTNL